MSTAIQTPRELLETVADLRFPTKTDARLRWLMDRNTDGLLTPAEREELESLAELSESMSLVRAQVSRLLGRSLP